MKLIDINDYDICNYKLPSMFLIFPSCTFKCDHECGRPICQNSALAREPVHEVELIDVIKQYLSNPLTHAVVCGGLEPFDTWDDLLSFISIFRNFSKDSIIIYTGYTKEELENSSVAFYKYAINNKGQPLTRFLIGNDSPLTILKQYDNIVVKYGRFIPDSPHIFDTVLGVELASNNQYAEELS